MPPTKGARTRQRIVELAAPVFNRRGYAGASIRELVEATGLEKGGIYNHFGSKEQLALEAFDYAYSRLEANMSATQDPAQDAPARLVAMISAFSGNARRAVVSGGCPIMNTAIEADDTHPELRDRARHAMTNWHRLIGSIVKQGVAEGTLQPDVDPYELASIVTGALEGALMLARLYDDPAHMDRVVAHLNAHVQTLRREPEALEPRTPTEENR
jgi:AcrR family transcriptional regulator